MRLRTNLLKRLEIAGVNQLFEKLFQAMPKFIVTASSSSTPTKKRTRSSFEVDTPEGIVDKSPVKTICLCSSSSEDDEDVAQLFAVQEANKKAGHDEGEKEDAEKNPNDEEEDVEPNGDEDEDEDVERNGDEDDTEKTGHEDDAD